MGHDRPRDDRPLWEQRLSDQSDFCRAVVACGYLTEEQMQRAAQRYRLGRSRDGGVIFWQIDLLGQIYDGKIMHYRPDCHRDHSRHPDWVSNLLKRHYLKDEPDLAAQIPTVHCLFGTHLLTTTDFTDTLTTNYTNLTGQPGNNPLNPFHLWSNKTVAVVESEKTAVIMSERSSSPTPTRRARPMPLGTASCCRRSVCWATPSTSRLCWNSTPHRSRRPARLI